jgi:predicted nucleic acid-binding protein
VIVVDTSVWIEANRHPTTDVAATLRELLDADEVALALPVRLELWAGLAKSQRTAIRRVFSALPLLVPTEDTWRPLEDWIAKAADAGQRFALGDLLIAGLTAEIGGIVWSLDSDFARMAELDFVQNFEAPKPKRLRRS